MLRNTLNTVITATLIMLLGVSSSAQAMVPAGSRITSTSTLTVEGLDPPLTATVTVTVGLQRSKPEIALKEVTVDGELFGGDLGDVQWLHGKTKTLTYKYTITTTANGQATYNVTAAVDKEGLSEAPSTEVDGEPISLGATAAISNQGLVVTVPYDGAADGVINGISPQAIVVINNEPYEVNNLRDSADASTLTLDKDPGELSPGTPIAEQQEYTVTLLGVVLADDAPEGGTNPTLTITATQGAGFEGFDAAPNNQSFLVIAQGQPTLNCIGDICSQYQLIDIIHTVVKGDGGAVNVTCGWDHIYDDCKEQDSHMKGGGCAFTSSRVDGCSQAKKKFCAAEQCQAYEECRTRGMGKSGRGEGWCKKYRRYPLNDAPVANPDSYNAIEDTADQLLNVLGNDTDPDNGASLSVKAVDTVDTVGTVVFDEQAGTILYTPGAAFQNLAVGETANDSFTYTVTDGTANTDATVSITVMGVNDAPVANNDALTTASSCTGTWSYGTIGGQDGWTTLTNDYAQPDTFPGTSQVVGDQPDRGNSIVGVFTSGDGLEEAGQVYEGTKAWWFKRGYDSSGSGTPQTPNVEPAGEGSAAASTDGVARDSFRYSFMFRAHQHNDGSRISVVTGKSDGTDRASNYVEVGNDDAAGMRVRVYDHAGPGSGWGGAYVVAASGLAYDTWHEFSATMTTTGVNDLWEYSVNGSVVHSSLGSFNQTRLDFGWALELSTRVKFQPKHANYNAGHMGFYFDSINVASWASADEAGTKSSYCADFNAELFSDSGVNKVIGGVGGGDGGSFPLTTGECKHDAEGLWAPDMNATKCKGVKWNAANGINHVYNPVCWDSNLSDGWQEVAVNPWVVGTARYYNKETYDCRTKCAGKTGESFDHCSTDRWWDNKDAKAAVCLQWNDFGGREMALTRSGGSRSVIDGVITWLRRASCFPYVN